MTIKDWKPGDTCWMIWFYVASTENRPIVAFAHCTITRERDDTTSWTKATGIWNWDLWSNKLKLISGLEQVDHVRDHGAMQPTWDPELAASAWLASKDPETVKFLNSLPHGIDGLINSPDFPTPESLLIMLVEKDLPF